MLFEKYLHGTKNHHLEIYLQSNITTHSIFIETWIYQVKLTARKNWPKRNLHKSLISALKTALD